MSGQNPICFKIIGKGGIIIEAISIISNGDFSNNAASPAVKSDTQGRFKCIMRASCEGMQNANQTKPNETPETFSKFHLLIKQEPGKMINIKAVIPELGGEEEQQDSMCCDSEVMELLDGIVGILEGFGLLDYTTDENVEDNIAQTIESVASNPFDAAGKENIIKMISQQIARMPNADQFQAPMQEAVAKLEELISEYQCSFDNTNNTGVEGQEGEEGPKDLSVQPDKLMVMINTAMQKAKGKGLNKGIQNERVTFEKGKNAETKEPNGAVVKNENGAQVFKMSHTLNAEGTALDQKAQQVTQSDMAENIAEMTEKITLNQMDGKSEFDVKLKPDSLGKLSIKLIMDGDGIKAHIKASDQFVKGLIAEQLPELTEMLKDKGVNMQHIEVVYDNPMFSSTDQQFQGQNPDMGGAGRQVRAMMAAHRSEENIIFDAVSDQTDLFIRNSSVEFSA